MIGQIEAVRRGQDQAFTTTPPRLPGSGPHLPDRRVTRAYWLVSRDDVKDFRLRASVHDHIGGHHVAWRDSSSKLSPAILTRPPGKSARVRP